MKSPALRPCSKAVFLAINEELRQTSDPTISLSFVSNGDGINDDISDFDFRFNV